MLPNGEPYICGRAPEPFPCYIKCFRCKRTTKLTASDWNRIPHLTVAQLEELKQLDRYTKDFEGAGFTKDRAKDLLPWASGPASIAEQFPPQETN